MVTGRKASLRTRVLAVLTSLVALWAFAAYVTVSEGMSLVWLATLEQQVAKPTEALLAALQAERRASVAFTAAGVFSGRSAMDKAREITDAAIARQKRGLDTTLGRWSTSEASDARLADLLQNLDTLVSQRSLVDTGRVDRASVNQYFTDLIQLGFDVYNTYTAWDNNEVIYMANTLVFLTQAQEMISREDALIAGVMGAGVFEEYDRQAFAELVGAQRYLFRQVSERLPEPDRTDFAQALSGPTLQALRGLETEIALATPGKVPAALAQWQATVTLAIDAIRSLVITFADRIVIRVRTPAIWIVVRLLLAAGLGLIAVVASIRFTIRSLRQMQRQLAELRVAALDLAHKRLPRVVDLLRRGEDVDVAEAAPPLAFGTDDIGQVGRAFNAVQQTAIQATVDQAELKRGVRDIFLSLAHRIQALVHRQLKLIDSMERKAGSDGELASLYRIDHLATRMRRNAENLIVLAGMSAGRTWRAPVSMVDIVRAALAEVEEYQRVKLRGADAATLSGRATGDVIHLLAELMENAVSFSPPQADIYVTGIAVHDGYLVEIEDRGLGMTEEDLIAANARIANPPEFQLTSTVRLGFFVVGRLAQRYGIRVVLRPSSSHGVTAAVLLPLSVLGGDETEDMAYLPESLLETVAAIGVASVPAREQTHYTPAGLPLRVRRTVAAPVISTPDEDPDSRSPQEIGRAFAAFADAVKRIPSTGRNDHRD